MNAIERAELEVGSGACLISKPGALYLSKLNCGYAGLHKLCFMVHGRFFGGWAK